MFFLGNKWRADNLERNYFNRIKLTHPDLRHYAIYVTMKKGRVGVAFSHNEKPGLNIILTPGIAVSGKLVLIEPKEENQQP